LFQENSENLSCLAASCAIELGNFEEAVELLDLGRSVFWQQASSLRSNLETLRKAEPNLAQEFGKIGWQLDGRNFSSPGSVTGHRVDQQTPEDFVKERHRLVAMWEGY
jgi:hypothetical protein